MKKLGRIRPPHRSKLHFGNYVPDLTALPPAPAVCSYASAAALVLALVFMNDQLGDCVVAGGYHLVGVWTGNATGTAFAASDEQIVHDYSAISGYVVGDSTTDQGCNEQEALKFWTREGFADGSKLAGWVGVDAGNPEIVRQAYFLFENLFLGIELPDAWLESPQDGDTWDVAGDANPDNGHCVVVVGYNDVGVQVCTWGLVITITWAALAKYASHTSGGEMYALLSPDEVGPDAVAPNGFDLTCLQSDLAALSPP